MSAIKIDVQGADLKVLQGARETIRRCRPAIVFEVEVYNVPQFGQCRSDALKLVEEMGYEVVEEPGLANYFILPKKRINPVWKDLAVIVRSGKNLSGSGRGMLSSGCVIIRRLMAIIGRPVIIVRSIALNVGLGEERRPNL